MAYQAVFKRYELKYLLTTTQWKRIKEVIKPYMELDQYGLTTIRNIYYDTDNYRLIRRSIEKPTYKEKLRIRSYQKVDSDDEVFVELKKKYQHVVYKRRIALPWQTAFCWLCDGKHPDVESQISSEINYVLDYYKPLRPVLFLSYEREAYYSKDNQDLRMTFDRNILCRQKDLSLETDVYGSSILEDDLVLMEIKCGGGIPLWLVEFLSKERIYKTSFSKYGTAYQTLIYPNKTRGNL